MRILVTGAAGFVGQAVVTLLAEKGYEVLAMDRECAGLDNLGVAQLFEGDIADASVRKSAIAAADAVVHLATIPGGAAEQDPTIARMVNVEATMALSSELAARRPGAPFIFASSIAVFGTPMPPTMDDDAPIAPQMLYGAHKAMMETWLATLGRRGEIRTFSLRLPGVVARTQAPSGMKSAFISNLFHALVQQREIELPVLPSATMWLMSVQQAARCFAHALDVVASDWPANRAVTLPAVRASMAELVAEICRQRHTDSALVRYVPDEATEQGFGRQPPLTTRAVERLGFTHDGDLDRLVRSALATL